MGRLLALGAVACGVAVVVQGSSLPSSVALSGQAVERVEFRQPPPSCADG